MAEALEGIDKVSCYVKNYGLGFAIPYTWKGEERHYYPDFIVRYQDGSGDVLNLVVEVSGESQGQVRKSRRRAWVMDTID